MLPGKLGLEEKGQENSKYGEIQSWSVQVARQQRTWLVPLRLAVQLGHPACSSGSLTKSARKSYLGAAHDREILPQPDSTSKRN